MIATFILVSTVALSVTWYIFLQNNNDLESKDPFAYSEVRRNIIGNPAVHDQNGMFDKVCQNVLDMGFYGNVSVHVPNTNTYRSEPVTAQTLQAVSNATVATVQRNLLPLSRAAYNNLGNATMLNPEIADFSKVIVHGKYAKNKWDPIDSDLWKDSGSIALNHHTLATDLEDSSYVLDNPESFQFFSDLLRQHNLVLKAVGLDPTNRTVRSKYVKPDIYYYYKTLASQKAVINGKEIAFPLLPLLNETEMKELFPDRADRAVIHASQYPVQLTKFNAVTGEYRDNSACGWTKEYGQKTLLDNMRLVWEGGKWGKFEGKLIDRVVSAYTDKTMTSYDSNPSTFPIVHSDYEWARELYNAQNIQFGKTYTNTNETLSKFVKDIDSKLAADLLMDLGHRFLYGLGIYDGGQNHNIHQLAPDRASLYAKALGGSSFEMYSTFPSDGYSHETLATPTPQYMISQLPSNIRYGSANAVCRFSAANGSIGLTVRLPNEDKLNY